MQIEPILLKSSNELLDDIEHHFKVIAGPGAGKTHWLTNHIKNVLNKSERLKKNRKIACITYTNVGVDSINKRIGNSIDRVEVNTIHSFLYKHIVKPYIFLIKGEYGFNPAQIDGHDEHYAYTNKIIEWIKSDSKKLGYLQLDLKLTRIHLQNLSWGIENDGCFLYVRKHSDYYQKYRIKTKKGEKELSFILDYVNHQDRYRTYKRLYWTDNILDHNDILFFSYELIKKHPEIAEILRSKFPYFFIDEFQDTNPIQTKIVKMLAEKETIVGIIGDRAQSIYKFQGADVTQFDDFFLQNMIIYKIENNHRSTEEILTVLNAIRSDIEQHNPDNKNNQKPVVLVGQPLIALKRAEEILGHGDICTLSYKNTTSCEMKNEYISSQAEDLLISLQSVDSNRDRKKLVISVIKGIEYARQSLFKDAIKEVSRCCRESDNFKGQKSALKIIHKMLASYGSYVNGSLFDFYTTLKTVVDGILKLANIRTSGTTSIKTFYKDTTYKEIILWIKYNDDISLHRTIHKAKGDEFDNVLVVFKDKTADNDTQIFNQEQALEFLLNPDLEKEDHRVYYVALSRAKERLFVNIPKLSEENKSKLVTIGFNIEFMKASI